MLSSFGSWTGSPVIVMTRQGTKPCLEKNGVKVISANENISEGSEGIILESILEGMAEYYSADLSEKVILVRFRAFMTETFERHRSNQNRNTN